MSAKIIDGKIIASKVESEIQKKIDELKRKNLRLPRLAVIVIGENAASLSYVKGKEKALKRVGMEVETFFFDEKTSERALEEKIEELNSDTNVDAILLQLPLPAHLNERRLLEKIDREKDADGFTSSSAASLFFDIDEGTLPCTPMGIMRLLDEYEIQTEGKHTVIIGRSLIVGKPLALLFSSKKRNSTVTLCHSATINIADITKQADILIAALGKPSFVKAAMVKRGAVVIDVGISRIKDESKKNGFRLQGDVDKEVYEKASYITPVPGGVGPMTVAMLLYNTLSLYEKHIRI